MNEGDREPNIVTSRIVEPGIVLTAEQKRRQRARSIALAVALGALCMLFYFVTLAKGPMVLIRPI